MDVLKVKSGENAALFLNGNAEEKDKKLQTLLKFCMKELKKDLKFFQPIIQNLSTVFHKNKIGEIDLDIFNYELQEILKTLIGIVINSQNEHHKACLETMHDFPSHILTTLITDNSREFIQMLKNFLFTDVMDLSKIELSNLTADIFTKTLKSTSIQNRKTFIKDNMQVWFSNLIPSLFNSDCNKNTLLDLVDFLMEDILDEDYIHGHHWDSFMTNINSESCYPDRIKKMLENNDPNWHRVWVVIIRLLGKQLHKSGGPINALLSVLEKAFKLSPDERCKAFQCWKVLADNFALDPNALFVQKRIKLLAVPLNVNNAKVEIVAVAKFDTWWHIIKLLSPKLSQYFMIIVAPFLNFCFGPPPGKDTGVYVPGLQFPRVKLLSLKAFTEIVGHSDCDGCLTDFERLDKPILNVDIIKGSNWEHWLSCLKAYLLLVCKSDDDTDLNIDQMTRCTWNSFLKTSFLCPEREFTLKVTGGLINILKGITKSHHNNTIFANLIVSCLVPDIFCIAGEKLFSNKAALNFFISLVFNKSVVSNYDRKSKANISGQKKFIQIFLSRKDESLVKSIFQEMPNLPGSVQWWCSTCQSIEDSCPWLSFSVKKTILLWIMRDSDLFNQDSVFENWQILYDKWSGEDIALEIDVLQTVAALNFTSNNYHTFVILMFPTMFEKVVSENPDAFLKLGNELKLFHELMKEEDTLVKNNNAKLTNAFINIVLKVVGKINIDDKSKKVVFSLFDILHIALKGTNRDTIQVCEKLQEVSKVIEKFKRKHLECLELNETLIQLENEIKTLSEPILLPIKNAFDLNCSKANINSESNLNNTPKSRNKNKTRTGKIAKVVLDGNEEVAIVKSNWKFNPKKLTDHQKEVLHKKREDIPALYQDLSQSQDNSLQVWKTPGYKTDSQDTSISKSNSTESSNTASKILKDIPNPEIVPNIIKTLFSNVENEPDKINVSHDEKISTVDSKQDAKEEVLRNKAKENTLKSPKSPSIAVDAKSPRLSLKDKINKNVQKLLSSPKSMVNNSKLDNSNNQKDSILTPERPIIVKSVSATTIETERPRRVICKPKKFEPDSDDLSNSRSRRKTIAVVDATKSMGDDLLKSNELDQITSVNKSDISMNESDDLSNSRSRRKIIAVVDSTKCMENDLQKSDDLDHITSMNKSDTSMNHSDDLSNSRSRRKTIAVTDATKCMENNLLKSNDLDHITSMNKSLEVRLTLDKNSSSDVENHINKKENNLVITAKRKYEKSMDDKGEKNAAALPNETSELSSTEKKKSKKTPSPEVKPLGKKRSKLEKELQIDMVEGHPILTPTIDRPLTRKSIDENTPKRRRITLDKLSNSMKENTVKTRKSRGKSLSNEITNNSNVSSEHPLTVICSNNEKKADNTSEVSQTSDDAIIQPDNKTLSDIKNDISIVEETIPKEDMESNKKRITDSEICSESIFSEDVIESSQDSSISNATVRSVRHTSIKTPLIKIQRFEAIDLTEEEDNEVPNITKENKTVQKSDLSNMGEVTISEMNTQPSTELNETTTLLREDLCKNTEKSDTNKTDIEIAEADTLPVESFSNTLHDQDVSTNDVIIVDNNIAEINVESNSTIEKLSDNDISQEKCKRLSLADVSIVSSPGKGDESKKKEFLNDTMDLSPIKIQSPEKSFEEKESNEPESNYSIISLMPASDEEESFEKSPSPEMFSAEKLSPDKMDQSPPRDDLPKIVLSPSCLKKNRPQVRQGGRGAQMLGLCIPDKFPQITSNEKMDIDEAKSPLPTGVYAKRNLRVLYHTNNAEEVTESNEVFLEFTKNVPALTSSPSGPILKRKFSEMMDDTTVSPVSKKKRVSFHDPPVSTTVSVQKYIEETGIRSPSQKNRDRLPKSNIAKSLVKKLENEYKKDEINVESCNSEELSTELTSLESTPVLEIVKHHELNNSDPICKGLIDCTEPISSIALVLSSPTMKDLLIEEWKGTIETIGDLAKLTELDINRLSIKAPKIDTARKALENYKRTLEKENEIQITEKKQSSETMTQSDIITCEVEDIGTITVHNKNADVTQCSPIQTETCLNQIQHVDVDKNDKLEELGDKSEDIINEDHEKVQTETPIVSTNDLNISIEANRLEENKQQKEVDDTKQILEKVSMDDIRQYIINKFSNAELIHFCCELMKAKVPLSDS